MYLYVIQHTVSDIQYIDLILG